MTLSRTYRRAIEIAIDELDGYLSVVEGAYSEQDEPVRWAVRQMRELLQHDADLAEVLERGRAMEKGTP